MTVKKPGLTWQGIGFKLYCSAALHKKLEFHGRKTMTKQSLASLFIKLMAVYVIVSCIPTLPQNLYLFYQAGDTRNVWMSLAIMANLFMATAIWLGLGLLIIRFADSIARKLVPEEEDAAVISISGGDSLYKVVFVCLGMLLTVQALPYVTQMVFRWYITEKHRGFFDESFYLRILPDIICFAIQLGLGVFLMIRPETVLGWIKKFQPSGNSPDDNYDDQPQEGQP